MDGELSQAFSLVCLNVAAIGYEALSQDTKQGTLLVRSLPSSEGGCGCADTLSLLASLLYSKQAFLNI